MRKHFVAVAVVLTTAVMVMQPVSAAGDWDFLPEWGGYYSGGSLTIGSDTESDGLLGLTGPAGASSTLTFAEDERLGSWEISKMSDDSGYYPPNSLRILNTSRSDGSANTTPAMLFDQYNRIGVGRRDPSFKFDLNFYGDKQARFLANSSNNSLLLLENQSNAGSVTGFVNNNLGASYFAGLDDDLAFKIGSDQNLDNTPFLDIEPNGFVGIGTDNPTAQLHISDDPGQLVRTVFSENGEDGNWRIAKTPDDGSDHRGAGKLVFAAQDAGGIYKDKIMVMGPGGHIGFGESDLPSVLTINERGYSSLFLRDGSAQFQTDIQDNQLQIKSMNSNYNVKDTLFKIGHDGEICIGSGC